MFETSVVFFIFNRPDLTARVFEAIAAHQPRRLLVVADGPRNEAERALCEQTRAVIQVDWECEVETNYADENMGCGVRVATGLDWAFSRVEAAIILEDDCLPHLDFFGFCTEMLERYRDDERVMHVSGNNFVPLGNERADYGFSRYVHIWGWATWRRAWRHYDVTAARWPLERENLLAACADKNEARYWDAAFGGVFRGEIDTWDYQWVLACQLEDGLAVVPRVNLVSNLGFREDATHTTNPSELANLPVHVFSAKHHPTSIERDAVADARERALLMRPTLARKSFFSRAARRARRVMGAGAG